ncbi:unnamed protein product [Blepharisma stoltei]|uniref:Peroxisomal membrane protein PMP34 n=1 Tax=Blepharisma stoltei TaxID=1481888 RepID=A0AAU9ID50_9CILI|nr:unnamed protein product [Blepharisma stoltei]
MKESLAHGISGSLSALIAAIFLHPFESLRTRMQATHQKVTFLSFIKSLHKTEGLKSLYSGFLSTLVSAVTTQGIYFLIYRIMQSYFKRSKKVLSITDSLIISFIASSITTVINTPIWTVNTRLMKEKSKQGIIECFQKIIEKEGILGLFKGLSGSLALTLNPMIQFAIYEHIKQKFSKKSNALVYFLFGAFSKFISTLVTYPIFTIRTRTQIEEKKALGFIEVMNFILQKEGLGVLYNGLSTKLMHTVLNSAIILAVHENLAKAIVLVLTKNK